LPLHPAQKLISFEFCCLQALAAGSTGGGGSGGSAGSEVARLQQFLTPANGAPASSQGHHNRVLA